MSNRTRAPGSVSVRVITQARYRGSWPSSSTPPSALACSALGLALTSLAVQVVTGHSVSWTRTNIVVTIIFGLWEFLYFAYSWAAGGQTFGMVVLGIRVVRADGGGLSPRRGMLRALVFPLSFLFFGLGFLGILVQREHRALHDLLAATAVIYSWDARAVQLRFLARKTGVGATGDPQRPAGS